MIVQMIAFAAGSVYIVGALVGYIGHASEIETRIDKPARYKSQYGDLDKSRHTTRKACAYALFWPYFLLRTAIEGLREIEQERTERYLKRLRDEQERLDNEIERLEAK